MHVLVALLLAALPPDAPPGGSTAPPTPPDGPPPVVRPAPSAEPARSKLLGAQLSAGLPQGFVASVVVRPIPWVRANVGFAHNILGPGLQGGLTFVPFQFAVTPALTLEAGRFFSTDVSGRVGGTFPDAFDPALRKFGYDFFSAQLGLELGSHDAFLFFLRGGLAWVRSGLADVRGQQVDARTTVDLSNPRLSATLPTVNLGFVLYLW